MNKRTTISVAGILLLGLACGVIIVRGRDVRGAGGAPRAMEVRLHTVRQDTGKSGNPRAKVERALAVGNLASLARAFRDWKERDPADFGEWLEVGSAVTGTAEIIAAALAGGGLHDDALGFSLTVPESHRGLCLRAVFAVQAATAPLDAWNLADALEDPELGWDAKDIILETGTCAAMPQLAGLALGHMESSGRASGLQDLLSRWSLQDPAEASAWLNAHAVPVEIRDEIARMLVFQCDSENRPPGTAIAWAESISEPGLRYQAVAAAARELAASQPGMVEEAIRGSLVLSPEEKQSLLASLTAPAGGIEFSPAD